MGTGNVTPAWLIAPLLAAVAAFFLPIIVVRGPIQSEITLSCCDLVRHVGEGSGEDSQASRPDGAMTTRLKRELAGLEVPLTGPIIIAMSLVLLVAHYALAPWSLMQALRRRLSARWFSVWMACGVGYGMLFILGAALTQRGLNEVAGHGVAQRLVSLFSKAAAHLYVISIGSGGILILVSSLIFLVAGLVVASRHRRHAETSSLAGVQP